MHNKEYMDKLLARFAKEGPAGCACAVAQRGEVLYEGYAGYADRESGRLIDADTVYRLFSMTKVITCAAALILYERGEFLLNEPLYEYIPEYRDMNVVVRRANDGYSIEKAKNPILVKHAFSMSCGIPYSFGDSPTSRAVADVTAKLAEKGPYDVVDHVRALAQVPLAFEPGTQWLYGHGHEIVAALIQVISGKTVGEFMKEEIFDRLGMTSTGYRFCDDIESRMAVAYERAEDGTLTPSDSSRSDKNHRPDSIYEGGGAGLFATVGDYLKFTQMLANGGELKGERILGRKTIDLFRANQLNDAQLKDFRGSYTAGYGYGLGVRTMMDIVQAHANTTPGEFGWTGALGTYTSIDPAEGASVVYMHQMRPNMEEYHHLRVRAAAYAMLK